MTLFIIMAVVIGFYMAWNIGANDVANAMGTSVGSKALTLKQAIFLGAFFEFAGALLVGSHVTGTVRKGIIDPMAFSAHPEQLMFGMFAALAAAAIWLNVASYLSLPVSTTHAIIGAIVGFGLVTNPDSIQWGKVGSVALSWFVSPALGALIGYLMFRYLTRAVLSKLRPGEAVRRLAPLLTGFVIALLCFSFIHKVLGKMLVNYGWSETGHVSDTTACLVSIGVGLIVALVVIRAIRRSEGPDREGEHEYMEKIFRRMQIMTACYVAFAHGANDVANAIAPLATVWDIYSTHASSGAFLLPKGEVTVSITMLLIGGVGIVIGLMTYGYRVIATVGKKITEMTPSRGFAAEFAAATVVLIFSRWIKMPISTTHVLIGAVLGVGLARGLAALNLRVFRSIALSWIITLPISAGLTIIIYYITQLIIVV